MTTRLLELGHRRIAFVTGPSNLTVANVRLQGYMAALVEAGLSLDPQMIITGNFDQESGDRAAHDIAQIPSEQRPTAIFAANDETAFGVMLGLGQMGWRVPNDISVCGFGDLPMARMVSPALTTVHIPLRQLGRAGALRLLVALRNEEIPALEVVPTSVVERSSTAPHQETL
jgi:DNA-binding LacI/PurR family transcriptional regulator